MKGDDDESLKSIGKIYVPTCPVFAARSHVYGVLFTDTHSPYFLI